MNSRRPPGAGRFAALVVLTAACTALMTGYAAASTTPTPSASATPAATASPSASGSHSSATKKTSKESCYVSSKGKLEDCQKPVSGDKIPVGAKDKATVNDAVAPSDLSSLVDTRTWTTAGGNTFPGAEVPYGMVQWSPDTMPDRNAGGGYSYTDTTLEGYSLTHLSGPGCGAAGDVPILPVTSAPASGTDPNNDTTAFSHTNEVAQAGYYSAQSNGSTDPITSEFTATTHSSMGRFTFSSGSTPGFLFKLDGSQNGDTATSATIVGNDEIQGSVTSGDFCGESDNDGQSQLYTVYFDVIFNQPFASSQIITTGANNPSGVYVSFGTSNPVVEAKVGISYVSAANAQLDWQTENPGWNFDAVKAQAQHSWDSLLGKIKVSGGSYSQTQEFYSLLYKDFLQPNVTSDVNGQFMGADEKVHTLAAGQKNQYGIYSGWDIYHSLAQLQAMLDPEAASDQAQSQVNYYSEDGLLQQWGYLQANNYVMVGDPSQSIISDYYAFGAKDFNTQQALSDMIKQATTTNDVEPGAALETKYGYLPSDGSYGCCNFHGTVASLLEDDTGDLALSNFASALGDNSDAAMLVKRANNWENLFDASNNLLTAKSEAGQFEQGVTDLTQQANEPDYVEGDAIEYLYDTPNDYSTLISLLGGDSAFNSDLSSYLSQPNGYGMYDEVSNEFDLGEQYATYYSGDPSIAQKAVNSIENTVYLPGPSGLANNDDLGAESSQYIWEMLGLYPENPGSDTLLVSTPGFPHAQIDLSNGRTINVNAPNAASDIYVKSLTINGQPYQKTYTSYSDLSHGATLNYTLSSTPTDWGTAPKDAPPSYTSGTKTTEGYLGSQTASVAPGSSTTVTVGADNATSRPQKVKVSLTAPSGVTVTPSVATIDVPPSSRATTTLTVSAAAGTTQNYYSVPITLTNEQSNATQSLSQTVLVAAKGSLLSAYDNVGVSTTSNAQAADVDGDGDSYSATALAADGFNAGQSVTVNGVSFPWPVDAGSGYPDNAVPNGQQVTVSAPAGTQQLGFLGSSTDGDGSGVVTLNYSDGTSQKYWLGMSDWTLGGGGGSVAYGNQIAAATSYRNCPSCTGGQQTVATYIFEAAVPVDSSKTLTSVTLPTGTSGGEEHIFSVGTSTTAMTGPVITSLSATSATAGDQVTINGSGFGASQGSGYVAFSDNGTNWGAPGNTAPFTVDSWSDTAITFTVPAAADGYQVWAGTPASATVVTSAGATSDGGYLQIAPTDNIADYFDNTGISNDGDTTCDANYDGDGYSYSATALATAGLTPGGTVTADGLTFTWPNVASCTPDNILADGQTMLVNGTAGASELGLLESASNGPASGTITINYTDGTSTTQTVTSSDWANGPGPDETAVATMSYRNADGGGSQAITMYIYATTVPIDSSKTVASVTFPDIGTTITNSTPAMHIWSVTTG